MNFPGIRTSITRLSESRIRIHADVLEPHEVSRAFFILGEGSFVSMPGLLGLPPAVLVESVVTERSHDLIVDLPRGRGALARLRVGRPRPRSPWCSTGSRRTSSSRGT